MNKEQRDAVTRLRYIYGLDKGMGSGAAGIDSIADVRLLLEMLTPPDKDTRKMVVDVPKPMGVICSYKCPLLFDDYGYTGCSNRCGMEWGPSGNGEPPAVRPGDGCPWREDA